MKTVTVTWTDPNPAGSVSEYRVSRNGVAVGTVASSPFREQLAPGTYTYAVVPANPQEVGPPASASVIIAAALQAVVITITVA